MEVVPGPVTEDLPCWPGPFQSLSRVQAVLSQCRTPARSSRLLFIGWLLALSSSGIWQMPEGKLSWPLLHPPPAPPPHRVWALRASLSRPELQSLSPWSREVSVSSSGFSAAFLWVCQPLVPRRRGTATAECRLAAPRAFCPCSQPSHLEGPVSSGGCESGLFWIFSCSQQMGCCKVLWSSYLEASVTFREEIDVKSSIFPRESWKNRHFLLGDRFRRKRAEVEF